MPTSFHLGLLLTTNIKITNKKEISVMTIYDFNMQKCNRSLLHRHVISICRQVKDKSNRIHLWSFITNHYFIITLWCINFQLCNLNSFLRKMVFIGCYEKETYQNVLNINKKQWVTWLSVCNQDSTSISRNLITSIILVMFTWFTGQRHKCIHNLQVYISQ